MHLKMGMIYPNKIVYPMVKKILIVQREKNVILVVKKCMCIFLNLEMYVQDTWNWKQMKKVQLLNVSAFGKSVENVFKNVQKNQKNTRSIH